MMRAGQAERQEPTTADEEQHEGAARAPRNC